MPGKQVKNWAQYEAPRRKGMSKERAARIANADSGKRAARQEALRRDLGRRRRGRGS